MQWRTTRRWAVRSMVVLLALLVVALFVAWMVLRGSLAQLDGTVRSAGLSAPVTVARDARGVPLISGTHRADIAYATGYIHAQERFFQMDLLRRVGAGELAELFGAKALPSDRTNRLHRFRARAERVLAGLTLPEHELLDRYVEGVNAGLNALSAPPFEYTLVGVKPRQWQAADSLLVVAAMYLDLQGNLQARELARGWVAANSTDGQRAFLLPAATRWDAALDGDYQPAASEIPAAAPDWWGDTGNPDDPASKALAMASPSADFSDSVGSNNWAIGGARTADGAAIVADDMHLRLSLPNIWYRLALRFPDAQGKERRVVGVTLPGALPTVVAGSNGRVAWGFTNSYGDYLDLITLGTDDAHPGQVRTPAGWEQPVQHMETIIVKGGRNVALAVRETSVGPIRVVDGISYAVHWLAHDPGSLNMGPLRMEQVNTVSEALDAAATFGIPAQNIVAGDDKGNIGWTIAGQIPRREDTGNGGTYPLHLDSGFKSFDGPAAPQAHPRIVNPANGQLSTANSRQLLGDASDVIGDGGFDIGARHRQVRDGVLALGARVTVPAAYSVALDDRALFISPWRERAIKVLDSAAVKNRPERAEFLAQLQKGWTGRASVDSTGYRLARQFMWSLHDQLYGHANKRVSELDEKATLAMASSRWPEVVARLLDEQPRGWLPRGHTDWRSVQLAAIDRAIVELTADGQTLAQATWGRRNQATITHPIAAASPLLAYWLSAPADPQPGDANMPRVAGPKHGQSQRMTVSPGREEQGLYSMPGGQSGHPLSPFYLNGHAEWAAGGAAPLLPGPAAHTLTFVRQ